MIRVVTVAREFSSGGALIAHKVAERIGVEPVGSRAGGRHRASRQGRPQPGAALRRALRLLAAPRQPTRPLARSARRGRFILRGGRFRRANHGGARQKPDYGGARQGQLRHCGPWSPVRASRPPGRSSRVHLCPLA